MGIDGRRAGDARSFVENLEDLPTRSSTPTGERASVWTASREAIHQEGAERAGHSLDVLLKAFAKCIDGDRE